MGYTNESRQKQTIGPDAGTSQPHPPPVLPHFMALLGRIQFPQNYKDLGSLCNT